jgi:hypothetical protein
MPHECAGGGGTGAPGVETRYTFRGGGRAFPQSSPRGHRRAGGHLQVDTYWKEGGERGNRQDRIWVRATPNVVTTRLFQ